MFIIRVYGLIKNSRNDILLTDEIYNDHSFTKFPGGGLQFGEGPVDCLKREFIEEFNLEIENIEHFYTTDFFQESAFHYQKQIISIYYTAKIKATNADDIISIDANVMPKWKNINQLSTDDVTFPIDKHVVTMLINKKSS